MSTTKEKIKTVLICVLLLGMIYLAYSVWFFDSPFEVPELESLFGLNIDLEMSEAGAGADLETFGIRPAAMLVKGESISRGAVYESAVSDELYKKFRGELAKVFAGGREIKAADEAVWSEAISGEGVFLDYFGNVPRQAINLWLGSPFDGDELCGRYFMLSTAEKNVKIFIKNGRTGEIFSQDTSVSSAALQGLIAEAGGKEGYLAASSEQENFRAIAGETIIIPARSRTPVISAYNAYATFGSSVTEASLDTFRLRDVSPGTYSEADGTAVYIADIVTLKITPSGMISYNDPRDHADETLGISIEYEGERPTLAEKTEGVRALVAALAGKLPSSGGIYLIESSASGELAEFTFGRHINGVPVDMHGSSYFARVSIKGDIVSAVRMNLRGYEVSAQSAEVLPEQLAAAAIAGSGAHGDMSLRYADAGAATVSPAWFTSGVKPDGGKEGTDELVKS